MEKIKSRWRKNYLEDESDVLKQKSNNTNESNNINNHHHHHHHHHNSNNQSSKHHDQSAPPPYEHIVENLYLDKRKDEEHRKIRKEARSMVCDCSLTKEERSRGIAGCLDNCLNRMLMIECGPKCTLGQYCLNKRFQKCESAKVEVFKTRKKGWGLRAAAELPANSFIMEYVGEVVKAKEFRKRVKKYSKQKIKHHYFMALRNDEIIDATVKGNQTRFINHSCEPNSETQKWTVNGDLRIGFFTIKNLQPGDEITFDYKFQRYGKKAQKCYCEAPSCRGYIGADSQTYSLSNGNSSEIQELSEQIQAVTPGFKIPRLNPLQRMEIEKKMNEELIKDDHQAAATTTNNDRLGFLEQKTPFPRTYFKSTPTQPTQQQQQQQQQQNGLVRGSLANKTNNILPVKRRFDSLTSNNIYLTPAPKISKEEHRQQFEMYARLKEATNGNINSFTSFTNFTNRIAAAAAAANAHAHANAISTTTTPTIPAASVGAGLGVATTPTTTATTETKPPNNMATLIVLANKTIEPAYAMDDKLAFSICNYDEYFSSRGQTLSLDDVIDTLYPYPGSYYTTPDGDTWFASVILDRRTKQPRNVIFNLHTQKNKKFNNGIIHH